MDASPEEQLSELTAFDECHRDSATSFSLKIRVDTGASWLWLGLFLAGSGASQLLDPIEPLANVSQGPWTAMLCIGLAILVFRWTTKRYIFDLEAQQVWYEYNVFGARWRRLLGPFSNVLGLAVTSYRQGEDEVLPRWQYTLHLVSGSGSLHRLTALSQEQRDAYNRQAELIAGLIDAPSYLSEPGQHIHVVFDESGDNPNIAYTEEPQEYEREYLLLWVAVVVLLITLAFAMTHFMKP